MDQPETPGFATAPAVFKSLPSALPHFEHLPNFQACAPPFEQVPDDDSPAEDAETLFEDASPGA